MNNRGTAHRWPSAYRSLQLKHSPFSLRCCISSHDSFFTRDLVVFGDGDGGFVVGLLPHGGLGLYFETSEYVDFFIWFSSPSLILAYSMVARKVRGLNLWTSDEISAFNPPRKVLMSAFCGHPTNWLANFSNSF
jgi:hypothetical protein